MLVTIITFANLGKKHNLKTDAILPVINFFIKEGALNRVVCLLNSGFSFKKTLQAIPALLYYVFVIPQKFLNISFPNREQLEQLFDFFAQWRIGNSTCYIFHNGYFLPRTLRRARARGAICVEIAGMAHPDINDKLFAMEFKSLGLSSQENTYNRAHAAFSHYRDFDYVIAQSDFVKESYVQAGFSSEKIYVAHPDIDITRFSPVGKRVSPRTFRVLYIAFTAQLKGLHYLLDAWEKLGLKDAELVLVGGYGSMPVELKERYETIIHRNPSIQWVGNSATPEEYYHTADILVFPSLSEGFGKVTLEAMACGLPVITTENARGIVEDGKTGFVVPIRDAQAIAEKIQYLYGNRDVAKQMGREARIAVENKKPFGEAVFEIYRDILRRENKT